MDLKAEGGFRKHLPEWQVLAAEVVAVAATQLEVVAAAAAQLEVAAVADAAGAETEQQGQRKRPVDRVGRDDAGRG